jgi:hypothetical protein
MLPAYPGLAIDFQEDIDLIVSSQPALSINGDVRMIVINREAPCNYTLCLPESLLYISPKIAHMDEQQV